MRKRKRAIEKHIATDATACVTVSESPHALPVAELLRRLRVSSAEGLSDDEVNVRRKRFGPNTITSRGATSAMRLLLHQFKSPVVYLLGGAAGLALYFGELEEGGAIVAVLAINALIGFTTKLKAARSIEALRALGTRVARVRRESLDRDEGGLRPTAVGRLFGQQPLELFGT